MANGTIRIQVFFNDRKRLQARQEALPNLARPLGGVQQHRQNQIRRNPVNFRPMTGRPFAPDGFDFTLSALFFHFQDWPATFWLVLCVDDPCFAV
jgi:hypothetical protein